MLQHSSDRYKKISMTKGSVKDSARTESQRGEGGPGRAVSEPESSASMLTHDPVSD